MIDSLHKHLKDAGFVQTSEPYNISSLSKPESVNECEVIATKDYFKVILLDVESNWKSLAQEVAKNNIAPCLVVTQYGNNVIMATLKDYNTIHQKPQYVVLDGSKPKLLEDFIKSIKTEANDDVNQIYRRVLEAFDRFSTYAQALDEFADNLEVIIRKTKSMIEERIKGNRKYETAASRMLKKYRDVINDKMELDDIKEMLIQHVLTYRIFALVYDEKDFHNTNAVAKSLEDLKKLLEIPDDTVDYKTMELIAESVTGMDQRQEFLKKIYETFYKQYDPAKADKDGIVYTPSEVVNFMVKSTDQLLKRHFGKSISDAGVHILDPATGTGTFPVYILREIGPEKIRQKFSKEVHANEISILPYYIAALNIEHTYKEIVGEYKEFGNICWMDTLDIGYKDPAKLSAWFEDDDNVKRISNQRDAPIFVVIGNPPYNATQVSFNNTNPTEKYPHIDKMIQEDYSKKSSITNVKSFDMYKRFLKWSSKRIKKKGMVVFVSNNAFLDGRPDDGFRKAVYEEFDHIYAINLKGNARLAGEAWRKEGGKVFGQQARVGVAISFLIKTGEKTSSLQYAEVADYQTQAEKLKWLKDNDMSTLDFETIIPTDDAIWLNQTDNDFDELLPILPRNNKESIFEESTLGVTTAKDEWVYDLDKPKLKKKMEYYISAYNAVLKKYQEHDIKIENVDEWVNKQIKWSKTTIKHLEKNNLIDYSNERIKPTLYRPFVTKYQYYDRGITHSPRNFLEVFKNLQKNLLISFQNPMTNGVFCTVGTDLMTDYHVLTGGAQNIPLWKYDDDGNQHNNVTEYGLNTFRKHYKDDTITGENIFYYTYAIFNDPKYEEKYRFNLQRDLPRIPLVKDFRRFIDVGKKLFELHSQFNDAREYEDLTRIDKPVKKNKVKLQLKKDENDEYYKILIDEKTILTNVPKDITKYVLGSRSPKYAIEWILEFYKENKNRMSDGLSDDESVRTKFSNYNFEDHKEDVISLLKKVTTVCVETVKLRNQLKEMEWGPQPKFEFTKLEKNATPQESKKKSTKNLKKSSKKVPKEAGMRGKKLGDFLQ